MKTGRKIISIFVLLAILVSTLSGLSLTTFAATTFDIDKLVESEAGTLGAVDKVTDSASSAGRCISAPFDVPVVQDATTLSKPDANYVFNIPADGTYQVWVKMKAQNNGEDSFWWRWDEQTYTYGGIPESSWGTYTWFKLGDTQLTKGSHTFYWCHREPRAYFDALVVSADPAKIAAITGGTATPSAKPSANPSASPSLGSGMNSKAKAFDTTDGAVMIEAESATIDGTSISVVDDSDASGGKATQMGALDQGNQDTNAPAGLEFNLKTDKKGSYAVWIRYLSKSDGSDSSWCAIDGAAYKNLALPVNSKDANTYGWTQYTSFVVLNEGQTVNCRLRSREMTAKIDKFIIISSPGYIPKDMGTLPKPGELTINLLDPNAYPAPTITPPAEHPRLLFKKSDLPAIKANMEAAETANAVTAYKKLLENTSDGNLPAPTKVGVANFNDAVLCSIEAKAFEYAVNGNEELGKHAVTAIKNFIKTCTYEGIANYERPMGQVIFSASEVYDWCYPLLSDQDKKEIIAGCEGVAAGLEVGWPPKYQGYAQGPIASHACEAQIQRDTLALGIAAYNEYPDIYNYVAGKFLSEFIEPRNFWATSNTQHQGSAYGTYRYGWDLWGQWVISRMSGQSLYIPEAGLTSYQWIYTRRPDGQLFREGDDYNEGAISKGTYWNVLGNELFYAANFYKDPYLKKELLRENSSLGMFTYSNYSLTPTHVLIFNDPEIGVKPASDLPLTKYFASPVGQMVARTGWNDGINAPDAVAFMKIGEYWGGNHNHLDAGNFQLYYKGILASESGYYDSYMTPEDGNYNKQTIAHNSLLIYDPGEVPFGGAANSGGQKGRNSTPLTMKEWVGNYQTGKVMGQEFGPDPIKPDYTYIAGDITKAYSDKVNQVLRSMIFLPLEDANHPAALVVMDKITASNSSFKKTFLLHSQQEPEISGNVSVIKRNTDGYNGMLTNQTLLPKNSKIEKIGGDGKQFWVNDKNYSLTTTPNAKSSAEVGWGRIEISPSTKTATDYFLNVMYVGDADKNLPTIKADLIETDAVAGAKIFDRAVVFAKDSIRLDKEVSFKIEGNDTALKVNVSGLKEGTWSISVNGNDLGKQIASKEGGIIYFTASAGAYKLTYVDANATKPIVQPVAQNNEGIDVKIGNQYLYSDVAPTVRNDRTLVPMRAIFEALNANVTWDEATQTATATKDSTVVKITQDSTTAYVNGAPTTLDVPAAVIHDRFMVPVRFVSEAMGAKVDWDPFALCVMITPPAVIVPAADGTVAPVALTSSSNYGTTTPEMSFDNDPTTYWCGSGDGEWIQADLGSEQKITGIGISWNQGDKRVQTFDVLVSNDGVAWKAVLTGQSTSGGTADIEHYHFKSVTVSRYVRVVGRGNTQNMFNSPFEIVIYNK